MIGSPWLPESPRYLLSKNRDQEALEVLTKLHDTGDPNHIAAKEEFYQIRKQLELERQTGVSASRNL